MCLNSLFICNYFIPQGILLQISKEQLPVHGEIKDRITDLHAWHKFKIGEALNECFAQYGLCIDGTPIFAEAECVVVRVIQKKTFKIIELIIHLQLYAGSLDGDAVAKHIEDAIAEYDFLEEKNCKVVMQDRASTNKNAMSKWKDKKNLHFLAAYCVSHGYSGCGKKHKMTIGSRVLKNFTKMVKFSMCQACTFFSARFGERPRKGGGVRWGIEVEHAEQTNRIGIPLLLTDYVEKCAAKKWSEKSCKKQLAALKDPQDMCKAIVEIAALVDVGTPLISNCYTCESKEPMVFVAGGITSEMNELYGHGIDGYGKFDELKKQAVVAEGIMKDEMVCSSATFDLNHLKIWF